MKDEFALISLLLLGHWNKSIERIYKTPQEVKLWHKDFLPLGHACKRSDVSVEIVKKIIDIYPKSLWTCDQRWNRLPLHWAIRCNPPNILVIEILIKRHPSIAAIKDENGRTPLNYLLWFSRSPSLSLVRLLAEAHPDVVRLTDRFRWTALHHAVRNGRWDIVIYLIDLYPQALLKQDIAGLIPRYHAVKPEAVNYNNYMWCTLIKEEEKLMKCRKILSFYPLVEIIQQI